MHDTLRNPLAVEVREFLDQMMILKQYRAARPSGARVLIVSDRGSATGRQRFLGFHHFLRS
jgi:predicted phosphoribosyltransferase